MAKRHPHSPALLLHMTFGTVTQRLSVVKNCQVDWMLHDEQCPFAAVGSCRGLYAHAAGASQLLVQCMLPNAGVVS